MVELTDGKVCIKQQQPLKQCDGVVGHGLDRSGNMPFCDGPGLARRSQYHQCALFRLLQLFLHFGCLNAKYGGDATCTAKKFRTSKHDPL